MTKDNITKEILFEIIEKSLNDLSIYERELINRDVHEDCINHRFAFYLEINLGLFFNIDNHKKLSEIYNLSVDAEYNKNYKEPKRYGDKTSYAIPDIIIHQRNSNDYNLLMVEAKKTKLKDGDIIKLDALLESPYNYKLTMGIEYLPKKDYFNLEFYFKNHHEVKHLSVEYSYSYPRKSILREYNKIIKKLI